MHYAYDYKPPAGSWESYLYAHFLRPQDWLHLTSEQRAAMAPPKGYATGKTKQVFTEPEAAWHEHPTVRLAGAALAGLGAGIGLARLLGLGAGSSRQPRNGR